MNRNQQTLPSIRIASNELKGKKVYLHILPGNNGDCLINWGALAVLRDAKAKMVNSENRADVILLTGGGGINQEWGVGINYINRCNERWPAKPLWICSSTAKVVKTDFNGTFSRRTSPLYFWAREKYSGDVFLKACEFSRHVHIGIDHDMAFQLRQDPLIRKLQTKRSEEYILIVERDDVESPTGNITVKAKKATRRQQSRFWRVISQLVPGKIKDFLIRNRRRKKNRNVAAKGWQNRAYVKMALNRIYTDIPSVCGLPIRYCDISNTNLCSMQEFLEAVAGASVIVTTRLHVCILSHLLSKRAYVTFGGCMPYKIKGVYEFSLKDDSNIKMLPYSLSESV